MILRSSLPSPFGRKIKIAAAMLGLKDRIEIVMTDTNNPDDPIRQQNPLGKIPALILDDGLVLFDSPVILEYLDHAAGGGKIIPASAPDRFKVLTQAALADGIIEAAILLVYEKRFRDENERSVRWADYQSEKVTRGLKAFEAAPPTGARDVAHISLACALGYQDLRFEGKWRADYPALVAWLDAFAGEIPSFEATRCPA